MEKPPFKRVGFVLAGRVLQNVFENLVLDMHPEFLGHAIKIEMQMDCDKESITITAEPCENQQSYLVRPEPGKHLDS